MRRGADPVLVLQMASHSLHSAITGTSPVNDPTPPTQQNNDTEKDSGFQLVNPTDRPVVLPDFPSPESEHDPTDDIPTD